jgi:hypothetical protein
VDPVVTLRWTIVGVAALVCGACGGDDGGRGDTTFTTLVTSAGSTDGSESGSEGGSEGGADDDADDDGSGGGSTAADDTTGAPPPEYPACQYTCTAAADCSVGGDDFMLDCVGGRCAPACTSDEGCIAYYSGWVNQSCTASSQCMYEICVAYEGGGGCAFGPSDLACADVGLEATPRMDVEGNAVMVCAKPTASREAVEGGSACQPGCTATSCGVLTCGADGKCHCDDDIQCYMAQAGERCDAEGDCQYACVTPADCPASVFDGTTTTCVP